MADVFGFVSVVVSTLQKEIERVGNLDTPSPFDLARGSDDKLVLIFVGEEKMGGDQVQR